jgi:hypothetical protein
MNFDPDKEPKVMAGCLRSVLGKREPPEVATSVRDEMTLVSVREQSESVESVSVEGLRGSKPV